MTYLFILYLILLDIESIVKSLVEGTVHCHCGGDSDLYVSIYLLL